MLCEFDNCDGYVLEHAEGVTCVLCNRLQAASFESHHLTCVRDEEVPMQTLIHEISYMIDRHIISRDCGEYADKLFRIVRAKKINYSLEDLVTLCVSQSVYMKYGLNITLAQLSYILSFTPNEKSFSRKHTNLCKVLPNLFCNQKIHTPPLAIFSLGIPKWKIKKVHSKCKRLLSKGNFSFSYEAALLCVLQKGNFNEDLNLLKFICSFPHMSEVQNCERLWIDD